MPPAKQGSTHGGGHDIMCFEVLAFGQAAGKVEYSVQDRAQLVSSRDAAFVPVDSKATAGNLFRVTSAVVSRCDARPCACGTLRDVFAGSGLL